MILDSHGILTHLPDSFVGRTVNDYLKEKTWHGIWCYSLEFINDKYSHLLNLGEFQVACFSRMNENPAIINEQWYKVNGKLYKI